MNYLTLVVAAFTICIATHTTHAQVLHSDAGELLLEETTEAAPFVPNAERAPVYAGTHRSIAEEIQANFTYPSWARHAGVVGTLHLRFTIDEKGSVRESEVIKGPDLGLHEAALMALEGIRFHPATQGTTPVSSQVEMKLRIAPTNEIR